MILKEKATKKQRWMVKYVIKGDFYEISKRFVKYA